MKVNLTFKHGKTGKLTRISVNLRNMLDKIIEQQKKKGFEKVSYNDAASILANRIDLAGGLRDETM